MKCIYCGANHLSEYCSGYHISSMNKTLEEVNNSITTLSEYDERALGDISGGLQSIHESFDALHNSQAADAEAMRDAVSNVQAAVSDSISDASIVVSRSIGEGGQNIKDGLAGVSGSVIAAGAMVMNALAGIGAVMQYRERMDQLRHKERLQFDKERLQFDEEASDAGRARRELKAAAALLFAADPSQAEEHVVNSLKFFPSSAETFRVRSIVEILKGEHKKACISLRAALKLANDGDLMPNNMNVNETVVEGMQEAVYVSCLSQLTSELALFSQEIEALQLLDDGIKRYHNNTDLQLVRLRILSKTPAWDSRYGECIARLVKLSPRYFNMLFLDHQFGRRLGETQSFLKHLRSDTLLALQNKMRTLMVVSKGEAEFSLSPDFEQGSGSFEGLIATIGNVGREIRRHV